MLPDYQYKHYYDQLCDACEDEMVSQDERFEEGGECTSCNKVLCQNCREDQQCFACGDTVCASCAEHCVHCPTLKFHEACLIEHTSTCNALTRAQRELEELEDTIQAKQFGLQRAMCTYHRLQEELQEANRQSFRPAKGSTTPPNSIVYVTASVESSFGPAPFGCHWMPFTSVLLLRSMNATVSGGDDDDRVLIHGFAALAFNQVVRSVAQALQQSQSACRSRRLFSGARTVLLTDSILDS